MKPQIGIVIQARTGSTRFPNKIIKKVDGKLSFLDILLIRLKRLSINIPIIVATSDKSPDKEIIKIANDHNVLSFAGNESNVLNRFIQCSQIHNLTSIVRICSDNPFIDLSLLEELVHNYSNEDYFSYSVNKCPAIMTHYGFFTEIVSFSALKKSADKNNKSCIEHVTNCIWKNEDDSFIVKFMNIEITNHKIRCTLDTEQDFDTLKKIYHNWYKHQNHRNINYTKLISYIEKNDELINAMNNQILKNTK